MSDNLPLFKAGDIAVWPPREAGGKMLYTISDGPEDGEKTYTSVFMNVSGHDLTPEEACKLYQGDEIEVPLSSTLEEGGTYQAVLAARGVNESEKTVGNKTYKNRTLDIGILLPIRARPGELWKMPLSDVMSLADLKPGEEAAPYGYTVGGVTYFRNVGSPEDPVTLSAKDVLQLAADKEVQKDGLTISVSEITTENEHGRTAQVQVAAASYKSETAIRMLTMATSMGVRDAVAHWQNEHTETLARLMDVRAPVASHKPAIAVGGMRQADFEHAVEWASMASSTDRIPASQKEYADAVMAIDAILAGSGVTFTEAKAMVQEWQNAQTAQKSATGMRI